MCSTSQKSVSKRGSGKAPYRILIVRSRTLKITQAPTSRQTHEKYNEINRLGKIKFHLPAVRTASDSDRVVLSEPGAIATGFLDLDGTKTTLHGRIKEANGISGTKKNIAAACHYVINEQGDDLPDFDSW